MYQSPNTTKSYQPRPPPGPKQSLASPQLLARYHDESYITSQMLQSQQNKYLTLWVRAIRKFGHIYPESSILLGWNLLVILAILYNYYEIPISIFFTQAVYQSEFQSKAGIFLNCLFTLCLFINTVFIRSLTAYYSQGKLITNTNTIIKRYVSLQFWLNSISWLALFLYIFIDSRAMVYVKLLFYLSGLGLARVDGLVMHRIGGWRYRAAGYKLARLLAGLLGILVWIASVFFAIDYTLYVGQSEYYPDNLWLTNTVACQYSDLTFIDLVKTYTWPVWLNYSMYWVLQTVSGLGYGDITPRNPIQVAYCDTIIIIFCLFYALFVNSVWQIMAEVVGGAQGWRSSQNRLVRGYEKNYGMTKEMIAKLQNYIFEAEADRQKQQKQKQINEHLPEQLRDQLQLARQKKIYAVIQFFNILAITLPQEYAQFLHYLVAQTKQCRYGEGQIVYSRQKSQITLCRLAEGEIMLHYENSKLYRDIKKKSKSNFFGVGDFLRRTRPSFTAKANKYSKISQLTEQGFVGAYRINKNIKQKHQQLFEELTIYNKNELSSEQCWVCGSGEHSTSICPEYFSWLEAYRDAPEIYHTKRLNKNKINFRTFIIRRAMANDKKKIIASGNHLETLYKQKERNNRGIKPKFRGCLDRLGQRNSNLVDETKCYFHYRLEGNM